MMGTTAKERTAPDVRGLMAQAAAHLARDDE